MIKLAARPLVGIVGLGLLVVGAVKAASVSGSVGAVVLVVAGALLLVSPFIISRVDRLSVSASGLELHLSREISELGAPKAAEVLDRTELVKFAESYAFVHEELSDPVFMSAKVHLQDLLVERAAAISRREKMKAAEIRLLFKNGSPMMRVLALGLMQGDLSLADGTTILSAIADSRSANEQFQGLKLALLYAIAAIAQTVLGLRQDLAAYVTQRDQADQEVFGQLADLRTEQRQIRAVLDTLNSVNDQSHTALAQEPAIRARIRRISRRWLT